MKSWCFRRLRRSSTIAEPRGRRSPRSPPPSPPRSSLRPPAELDVRVSPAATLLVPIEAEEVHRHRRRGGLVAALAAAAAVTILVPMWWDYPGQPAVPPAQTSQAATGTTGEGSAAPSTVPAEAPEQPREATEVATAAPAAPAAADRRGAQDSPMRPLRSARPHRRLPRPAGEYQLASDQARFRRRSRRLERRCSITPTRPRGRRSFARAPTATAPVLRITRIVDDAANNFHVRPSPDGKPDRVRLGS